MGALSSAERKGGIIALCRLLEQAAMVQTLTDAEALVFMEKNFPQVRSSATRSTST